MGVLLELQLEKATVLKNVLEALSDVFSEANFDFSDTGCEIRAVDTSGVALVAFLRATAFTHYHYSDDISMGLRLTDMAAAFRFANKNDKITIEAEEGWPDPLCLTLESPEKSEISYFCFDGVDIKRRSLQIQESSESEYQAIVRLDSARFMPICNRLSSSFEDREDIVVLISVDKDGVRFSSQLEKDTCNIGSPKEAQIEMKEKVSLMFALRYIKAFSKVSALSDQVTILLSSKKPAVFKCEIPGMGTVRYYISPVDEMQNKGTRCRTREMEAQSMPVDEDEMHKVSKKKNMRCTSDMMCRRSQKKMQN